MGSKKVVALGATGMIGSVVTHELVKAGHAVTAIVRSADQSRAKLPSKVEVHVGDAEQPETLTGPVQAADIVFFALSVDPKRGKPGAFNPERDGLNNVIKAIGSRQAPRILYLASLLQEHNPHDWWVLEHKEQALRALEKSGIAYTVFKPSNFMENIPQRNLRGKSISLIGKPRHANWWIAAEDFGRQVASHISALPNAGEPPAPNRTYVVQGPKAMDYEQAAKIYADAKPGEALKVTFAPVPILRLIGTFVTELKYAVNISQAINESPETFRAQQTWDELGKPTISMQSFALHTATANR